MLRRILITLTVAAGILTPMTSEAATTHVVELREDGKQFYIAPASVVVAPGDTVVITNRSTIKNAKDVGGGVYWTDPDGAGPLAANWPSGTASQSPTGNTNPVWRSFPTYTTTTFTIPAGFQKSTAVINGQGSGVGTVADTPFVLTTTAPEFPPQAPVLSSPEPDAVIPGAPNGTNPVTFTGKSLNAKTYRVEIRNLSGNERQWDREYFGLVDGNGNWSTTVNVANGLYRVQAFSRHWQGYEAAGEQFFIEVDGNDIAAPFMDCGGSANGCVKREPDRGYPFIGANGHVDIDGVVVDDITAKSITITVQGPTPYHRANSPQPVNVRCYREGSNGVPDSPLPCNSASNPSRLKFRADYTMQWQGSYSFVFTATDGVGKTQTYTKTVSMSFFL